MTTAQVHTLIGPYALNAVDARERELVEDHIAECESCAEELSDLRATAARLSDYTMTTPPPRLREDVLARVRQTRQLGPTDYVAEEVLRPRKIRDWRRMFVAAAAAVVMALAGGAVTFSVMDDQLATERDQASQIDRVLSAPDARFDRQPAEGGGQVSVVSSASHDEAVVILSDLADIPADQAYQLWLVNDDRQLSAGVIEAGRDTATRLVSGISKADLIGVTTEPAGGSATPTLPMVAGVALKT